MDFENILTLVEKEIRDSFRNRWFILYSVVFALLALALSFLALSGSSFLGFAGFGRTAASLINLVLLIVPLMALTVGALSIAGERERGSLSYLLSQPVTRTEVFLGKYLGLAASLLTALVLGFGLSGCLLALQGEGSSGLAYFGLVGLAFLLALAMLSLGFLVSTFSPKGAVASGFALFLWLAFVFFGDLGMMGTTVVMKLKIGQVFALALANPLQLFKMSAILNLRSTLEVLGPAGIYGTQTFGSGLMPLLLGVLAAWVVGPLALALVAFKRGGET